MAKKIFKTYKKESGKLPENIDTDIPDYKEIKDHKEVKKVIENSVAIRTLMNGFATRAIRRSGRCTNKHR